MEPMLPNSHTYPHTLRDYYSYPLQQQHQVLGKLPLLTFPASSQSVLRQYQATCSFSEHIMLFHSFVFSYVSYVWDILLPNVHLYLLCLAKKIFW